MAVQNKDCYKVVTIGYLKSFIGQSGSSSLIKDKDNESVSKIITRTDDTYCPTYGELIGGSIIQTWFQGSTPNGDRDGITVSSAAILGGNYATNQLVDQHDLELRYTRFKSFTVSAETGDVSQCSGSTSVSYTHKYTRYEKSMNDSCAIGTTDVEVYDTTNSEVNWTGCTWLSVNKNTLVVTYSRQPESRTAGRRYCDVKGEIKFRGTPHSDTTRIYQKALGGGYTNYEGRHYTSVTVYPSTTSTFGCGEGSFSVTSTGFFYDRYEWKDDCGTVYHSSPYDDRNGSEDGPSSSGSFGELVCDCVNAQTRSQTITINYHGIAGSATFNQSCPACPDDSKCCPCTGFSATGAAERLSIPASGGTNIVIGTISMASCMSNPRAEPMAPREWISDLTVSGTNVIVTIAENTGTTWRTEVISLSADTENGDICEDTNGIRIRQNGAGPAPTCDCSSLTVTGKTNISKDGGDNVTIGTISKASCMSNATASSSESWLSNITVSGNDVKATVGSNSDSSPRSGSVTVTVDTDDGGTCDEIMRIKQLAGGGGTRKVTITYKYQWAEIEKPKFKFKLVYPGGSTQIDEVGTNASGTKSGTTMITVDASLSDQDILDGSYWEIATGSVDFSHLNQSYTMTYAGADPTPYFNCDTSSSQPFDICPEICGPNQFCAGVVDSVRLTDGKIVATIRMTACMID